MRFVAHALEQLHGGMIQAEPQGCALAGAVDFLELLRQTDDGDLFQTQLDEFGAGGVELAFAAVIRIKSEE
jgi:hypothetical protein